MANFRTALSLSGRVVPTSIGLVAGPSWQPMVYSLTPLRSRCHCADRNVGPGARRLDTAIGMPPLKPPTCLPAHAGGDNSLGRSAGPTPHRKSARTAAGLPLGVLTLHPQQPSSHRWSPRFLIPCSAYGLPSHSLCPTRP